MSITRPRIHKITFLFSLSTSCSCHITHPTSIHKITTTEQVDNLPPTQELIRLYPKDQYCPETNANFSHHHNKCPSFFLMNYLIPTLTHSLFCLLSLSEMTSLVDITNKKRSSTEVSSSPAASKQAKISKELSTPSSSPIPESLWTEYVSDDRKYWHDSVSNITTDVDPYRHHQDAVPSTTTTVTTTAINKPLPVTATSRWLSYLDKESGNVFYYDTVTLKSQWENPLAEETKKSVDTGPRKPHGKKSALTLYRESAYDAYKANNLDKKDHEIRAVLRTAFENLSEDEARKWKWAADADARRYEQELKEWEDAQRDKIEKALDRELGHLKTMAADWDKYGARLRQYVQHFQEVLFLSTPPPPPHVFCLLMCYSLPLFLCSFFVYLFCFVLCFVTCFVVAGTRPPCSCSCRRSVGTIGR